MIKASLTTCQKSNQWEVFLMEGETCEPTLVDFEPLFYYNLGLIRLIHKNRFVSFLLYSNKSKKIIGQMILSREKPRQWISVASLPFGSVNGPANCPAPALDFLLTTIETWLQSNAQQSLLIRTPSPIYATPSAMDLIIKKRKYTLYERKINLHIQLDDRPFVDRISTMEKRRLLKARKAAITSRQLEPRPTPADTYDWLEVHRQMRGYTLSINKKEFCEMLLLFPEHYILFGTELHGKLLALAVAVRVSPSVLYTFLLADDPAYRHFSPQILLYEAAYSYCQNMGIPYLDLGLSLDSTGAYKPSLALFKRRIGGVDTFKNDWFKVFDSTSKVI